MKERTVLASFYSEEEAKQAAEQIKALGIEVAEVDQLHAYNGFTPEKRSFTISGDIPSLASLTLNTTPFSRDAGILMAADPSASGMSDGQDNITGRNYLLTVISPNETVPKVVSLIKSNRGYT